MLLDRLKDVGSTVAVQHRPRLRSGGQCTLTVVFFCCCFSLFVVLRWVDNPHSNVPLDCV